MMKRLWIVLLSVLLVTGLILSACSSPAQTTSPSATPGSTQTQTQTAPPATGVAASPTQPAEGVITLRYADGNSRNGWYGQNSMLPWIESMEKATNGRVKIEIYDSETLLKHPAIFTGVSTGVADIGWTAHVVLPGKFPLGDVITLPLLPLKSAEHSTIVWWKLFEKYQSLRDEYKDVKVLGISPSEPYFLLNNKREIKTAEDIKGLKLRVSAGAQAEMLKAMGASPLSMSMSEIYLNLQKGVLDGLATPWEAVYSFKLYEVAKYYTYVPLLCNQACRVMNLNTWNSLPPDIQQALDSANGVEASRAWGRTQFDDMTKIAHEEVKNKGYEMVEYTLSDEELEKWRATYAKPIWDAWVKKMNDAGHPEAQAILDDLFEFAKTPVN